MTAWRGVLVALRPKTLAVGIAPVALGTAMAAHAGGARWGVAALCLLGALSLQVTANAVNDLFDFLRGADGPDRLGPPRAVASGLISSRGMAAVAIASAVVAIGAGAALIAIAGAPIAWVGVTGLAAAVLYTAGPAPLAYLGIADAFVFAYFGVLAVGMTYFAQTGAFSGAAFVAGAALGLFATAVLTINNVRDIEGDARAGKRTVPVRLGRGRALGYLAALFVGGYALVLAVAPSWLGALPLLTIPVALGIAARTRTGVGAALNRELARAGQLELWVTALWLPAWLL